MPQIATVRYFDDKDLKNVLEIDKLNHIVVDPFLEMEIVDNRALTTKELISLKAQEANRIGIIDEGKFTVGFIIFALNPTSFEILRLAIRPDCQRNGFGSTVVDWMLRKCEKSDRRPILECTIPEFYLEHFGPFFKQLKFKSNVVTPLSKIDGDFIKFNFNVRNEPN